MKENILLICKKLFAFGFLINDVAFFYQGYTIYILKNAESVSLLTYSIFTILSINGIFYGHYHAKDKVLALGCTLMTVSCMWIIVLKLLYG